MIKRGLIIDQPGQQARPDNRQKPLRFAQTAQLTPNKNSITSRDRVSFLIYSMTLLQKAQSRTQRRKAAKNS
jgi:hypothetical protein